jgi:hypothetical protein
MIKKISFSLLFSISILNYLQAQIVTVSPGTNLLIKQGTSFSADSLVLTPSADFTLSNISISRNTTVTHPANNVYIARVYNFSGNTNAFSGTIQFNYNDGAELNGLSENTLELNIHDGSMWQSYNSATNDAVNNYVLTNLVSGIQLNELTLAASGFALPLQWRSFIATKQRENVLLQWSTYSEQNTKYFIVQSSPNSVNWKQLAKIEAAGNSTFQHDYNYVHTTPTKGYNYYRIVETDADGKHNYSVVQKIYFEVPSLQIELLGNPVINGMLQIRVDLARQNDKPPMLQLYTNNGKLLLKAQSIPGVNSISVNGYAKGMYLLQANGTIIKFLIK